MNSERRLRLIRIGVVLGIAVGAGHVAQSNSEPKVRFASVIPGLEPDSVVPLAATAGADIVWREPLPEKADLPILPHIDARPVVAEVEQIEEPLPEIPLDCTPKLSLSAAAGAMIDVHLAAACRADTRVVLRHAGLAVTYKTNSLGALSVSVPALAEEAQVSILFAGGDTAEATLSLPEAGSHQRFGVQWLGPQAFQVNAFEDGADYWMPGHISASDPHVPADTLLPLRGFLTVLGDDQVETPMLAEIYTFPAGADDVPVVIEAAVTPATCGHEILGETLSVSRGRVKVSDLSVTMPGCDAVGDYLVLKNLVPDLKLAAAN